MKPFFFIILFAIMFVSCGDKGPKPRFEKGDCVHVTETLYHFNGSYIGIDELTKIEPYRLDSLKDNLVSISPQDKGVVKSVKVKRHRYKTGKTKYKSYIQIQSIDIQFDNAGTITFGSHDIYKYICKSKIDDAITALLTVASFIIVFFIIYLRDRKKL